MTVSQGYPDYSRLTPWSDAIFVNDQTVTVSNLHTYSRMFVANVRALLVNFIPSGSNQSITIRWYTDANNPNFFYTTQISANDGQRVARTIRPMSPYCDMVVGNLAGGNITYTLVVSTTANTQLPILDDNEPVLINNIGLAIAASTTLTINATRWWSGKAFCQAFTSGSAWTWVLSRVDYNGNVTNIAQHNNTGGLDGVWVPALSGLLRVAITNSDASGRLYWIMLTGDPTSAQ